MKQTILTIALLIALNANATGYDQSTNANAGAVALSGAISGATGGSASNGNTSAYVGGYDAEKNAVHSAIAPSITQNAICPIVTPNSHAVQFLVFGGSTTGTQSLNAICVAYHLKQYEILEQMTCAKSAEYRKANGNCK